MTTFSYNPFPSLSENAKEKIMRMVDLGLIEIHGQPERHEALDVHKFIQWYLDNKSK